MTAAAPPPGGHGHHPVAVGLPADRRCSQGVALARSRSRDHHVDRAAGGEQVADGGGLVDVEGPAAQRRLTGGVADYPGADGGGGVVEHGRLQRQLGGGRPPVVAAMQPRRAPVGSAVLGRHRGRGCGQAHRTAVGQHLGGQLLDDWPVGVDPGRHLPHHVAMGGGGVVGHRWGSASSLSRRWSIDGERLERPSTSSAAARPTTPDRRPRRARYRRVSAPSCGPWPGGWPGWRPGSRLGWARSRPAGGPRRCPPTPGVDRRLTWARRLEKASTSSGPCQRCPPGRGHWSGPPAPRRSVSSARSTDWSRVPAVRTLA